MKMFLLTSVIISFASLAFSHSITVKTNRFFPNTRSQFTINGTDEDSAHDLAPNATLTVTLPTLTPDPAKRLEGNLAVQYVDPIKQTSVIIDCRKNNKRILVVERDYVLDVRFNMSSNSFTCTEME